MTGSETYYSEAEMQEVLQELQRQTDIIEALNKKIYWHEQTEQSLLARIEMLSEQDELQKKLEEQKMKQEELQKKLNEQQRKLEEQRSLQEEKEKNIAEEKASLYNQERNLQARIEEYEEEVEYQTVQLSEEYRAKCDKKLKRYIEERKIFNIVTACIAIITVIFSARSQKAFWSDFKGFWEGVAHFIVAIVKPFVRAVGGLTKWVYDAVPYKTFNSIASGLVGVIAYAIIPLLVFLLIKKKGKVFWNWYKRGFNIDYVVVTTSFLLIQMFWGQYFIKKDLPEWNLWSTSLLFALGYSLWMANSKTKKLNTR